MNFARRLFVAIIISSFTQLIATNQLVSAHSVEGPKTRYCEAVYSAVRKQWQDRREFDQPLSLDVKVDTSGGIELVSIASASISPIRENLLGRVEVVDAPKAELSSAEAGRQFLLALKKMPSPSTFSHKSVWLHICLSNSATQTSVSFRDVGLESWALDTQQRILKVWFPPKCNPEVEPIVLFKVARNGRRSDVRLARKCGVLIADQAALKAVDESAPFSALPDGSPETIELRQFFHPSVWGRGKGKFRNF